MTVKEAILTLNANVVIACERAGFSSATVKMIEDALDTIEDALKAQEPKRGRWIEDEYGYIHCGVCGMEWDEPEHPATNYCPNCGARMDGDADG